MGHLMDQITLRNRLLVATAMWKEAVGEPLPRLAPGEPADQLRTSSCEWSTGSGNWPPRRPPARSLTGPGTWSTTGPTMTPSNSESWSVTRRWPASRTYTIELDLFGDGRLGLGLCDLAAGKAGGRVGVSLVERLVLEQS